jgi:hypothetical protein
MSSLASSFAFASARPVVSRPALALAALLLAAPLHAVTLDLYVGADPGLPATQGSLAVAFVGGGSQTRDPAGFTRVDTSAANNIYAGYSNRQAVLSFTPSVISPGAFVNAAFPVLDRAVGFSLDFTFRLVSQTNDGPNGADRAGFSITLLGSDHVGIELGFRTGQIFAQSAAPLFTTGETTASFGQNPGARDIGALLGELTSYTLTVQGDSYSLRTGGDTLLVGATRDYSSFTGLGSDAYDTGSFLFLGDNTTSARAVFDLAAVSVAVIPEPSALGGLLGLGALGLAALRRSSRKR